MTTTAHTIIPHGRLLSRPVRQPDGTTRSVGYELGGFYQLDRTHCLLAASLDEQGGGDKCVGNDAFIFSRLSDIREETAIPLNGPLPDYPLHNGMRAWVSMGPATGCMVPLGAVLDDGAPHPGAGAGLLSATGISFNTDGTSIIEGCETLKQFLQLRWDGSTLQITRTTCTSLLGFDLLAQGITAYLPDGDAILAPFLTTDGIVVFRFAFRDGGWEAVAHGAPFLTSWNGRQPGAVTYMHSGESEPSIARADGSYWIYTRGEDDAVGRWYRSDDGLNYRLFLETPNHTVPQPMSQGLQGELYVATNPFPGPDGAWLRNPLLVKTFTGDGYGAPEIVHDEGGIRDQRGDRIPFVDHAAGSSLFLEGRWRHFLLYRLCDLKERTPYAFQTDLRALLGAPKPRTTTGGLYLAEFAYDRVTHPPFRFARP